MKIKTKEGAIHEVIDLDFETGRTLNGYVCDDGNTYPVGECELIKPDPQYKKGWVPEYEEDYWSVLGDGVHITISIHTPRVGSDSKTAQIHLHSIQRIAHVFALIRFCLVKI